MADLRSDDYKFLKDSRPKMVTLGATGELEDGEGNPVDVTKSLETGVAGNNYTKHIAKARLADTEVLYLTSPFIPTAFDIFSIEALISIRQRPSGGRMTAKFIFSVECDDTSVLGSDKQEIYNNDAGANFRCEIIEGNETFTVRVKNTSGGSLDVAGVVDILSASYY